MPAVHAGLGAGCGPVRFGPDRGVVPHRRGTPALTGDPDGMNRTVWCGWHAGSVAGSEVITLDPLLRHDG